MSLLTQSKNSISTLETARQPGVHPDTASLMRHKLMNVMADRESPHKFDGRVEMHDAVMGGETSVLDGGKQGCGGPNKTPFAAAPETRNGGHSLRLLLHVVKARDSNSIEAIAKVR